jgi:hypothetical protein
VLRPKNRYGRAIWLAFVCAHARSYVCMKHENVSGLFATQSCFRNVRTRHEPEYVRKCMLHADMCGQKGMQSYELACAHQKPSEISGAKRFFRIVARPVRRADAEAHSGLGRACNMKACVVVSKSRLREYILLFLSKEKQVKLLKIDF